MDHIVYLDYKANELPNLLNGSKTMIIRGAMGHKIPYKIVEVGDVLYFVENNGSGNIKAKGFVENVVNTEMLSPEESLKMVEENQKFLLLNEAMMNRFAGKRYLVLITVKKTEVIDEFKFDKTDFFNMDDWLPIEDIEKVKLINNKCLH